MSSVVRIPKGYKALLKNSNSPPTWLKSMARRERDQRQRWFVDGVPFPVGQKKVYLPKFNLVFHNTPQLSAKWARFTVPPWFNKLDLRDYLWHAYGVRILSVRTYILPSDQIHAGLGGKTRIPRIMKTMTVELEKPFVWPEAPEDLSPWEKTTYDRMEAFQLGDQARGAKDSSKDQVTAAEWAGKLKRAGPQTPGRYGEQVSNNDFKRIQKARRALRARAEDILSGKVKWGQPGAWMPQGAVSNNQGGSAMQQR